MQIVDPAAVVPPRTMRSDVQGTKGVGDFGNVLALGAIEPPADAGISPTIEVGAAGRNVAELLTDPEPIMGTGDPGASPAMPDMLMIAGVEEEPDALPEGVLYPWRLVAQPAMSQLGQMAYGGARGGQEPVVSTGRSGVGRSEVVAPGMLEATPPYSAAQTLIEALVAPAPIMVGTAARIEHAGRGSTIVSTEEAAPVLGAWLERIQRRVENADGQATVWLRDYRIDDASSASIISDIIAFYGPARPVWRIVVNGSEIWRRPSTQPGEG
ncbi:hypothetical protein [Stenotrophomonas nitritireducens]|uniref:hypothetical protein n=1 Tax=Stenotrophomonas nitritireducens TaxID=83617 RepID=UPI003D966B00